MRRLIRALAGLAFAALAVWVAGPAALLERLQGARIEWFAAALAVAVLANTLSALRWAALARALGLAARDRDVLVYYFRGVATNSVAPGGVLGGDALRAAQLGGRANTLAGGVSSVVADRVVGVCAQASVSLLALLVAVLVGSSPLPQGQAALYAALLVAILALPALPLPFISRLRRELLAAGGEALARPAALAALVALGSSTTLWLCLQAVGAGASWLATVGLACGVFIGSAVPLAWAGFGPREVAAALFLTTLASGAPAAVAASVLYGLAGTLQGIAAAPLFALGLRRER